MSIQRLMYSALCRRPVGARGGMRRWAGGAAVVLAGAFCAGALSGAVASESDVTITAGAFHTCGLTSDGSVKCWGDNDYGGLGDGTITDRLTPVDVSGLKRGNLAVDAGFYHSCAVTKSGGAKCWGYNANGQLGNGSPDEFSLVPVNVHGLKSGVAAIAGGYYHSCAINAASGLECWGDNSHGELGDGSTKDRHTPVDVKGLASAVTAVTGGFDHTCALTDAGGVKCWGANTYGELGDGTTKDRHIPVDVTGLSSGVVAIAAGNFHTCAVMGNGGMKCWGFNGYGELGDGSIMNQLVPVDVQRLKGSVAAAATGYHHTCARLDSGGVECWGRNDVGQIGDGTTTERHTPVIVKRLSSGVGALAAGAYHNCVLMQTGGAKCWGYNNYGQLGDGTQETRLSPVDVKRF